MSSTVRKMSVTGETGSYIFILTVSKMPNIYIVWDKMEFKLFGLMWVSYRPASIRARAVLSLDRVAGVSRTGIKQPPMHYCARFFFFLFSQSLLWLAEPLSDTTPAGSEPFGMFLLTMILVYILYKLQRAKPLQNIFRQDSANFYKNIFKSSWPYAGPLGELQRTMMSSLLGLRAILGAFWYRARQKTNNKKHQYMNNNFGVLMSSLGSDI